MADFANRLLVSIIIPCYNAERWVAEAVQSCLEQTYAPIEIIVIDDGSTDGSLQVLAGFGDKIKLESGPNRGGNRARNRGIELSAGDYIQFLDADDKLMPTKLEHQVNLILQNDYPDLVVGSNITRRTDGREIEIIVPKQDPWTALARVELGNTVANLWKASKIIEVGQWAETMKSSQEYELMFRLLQHRASLCIDQSPLTLIRKTTGSITSSNLTRNIITRINLLCQVRDYLIGIRYKPEVVNVVRQALFDVVRELYNHDANRGIEYFYRCVEKGYRPKSNSANSSAYVIIFGMLGFVTAQRINHIWKILKGALRRHKQ